MNRRILPSLVAAATLVAAGCAQGPSDNPTGYGPTSSTPSPTNSDETKAIENFDFTSAEWYDARSQQTLKPAATGSQRDSWWRIDNGTDGNPVQYGDLNGDGYEDAVAWLTSGEGDGYWHYAYVWTWDPEQGTAVQSPYPVTDDASCGNATESLEVDADSGEIKVTRLIRNNEPCSELPAQKITNTIALENGVPIRTSPLRASTSPCLAPASDSRKTTDVLTRPLKLAPEEGAPELALDRVDRVVLGGGRDQTVNGYHQVLYRWGDDSLTWYCAYTDEVAIAGG
ncbi:hypothetical protein [Propionibacterium australiense]|uniref:Prokaryotic membrane lipoprotein lipid attachment site profile n=1 Tax=Propionibacterium australiense TaxID=119981 RepID=A0A383S7G3_9ACTN|nr:hypothetical protein [Propionibacterium australiense]RLP07594.1 hypothetical protein D9T14_09945 [Propionibacterium australiense]RLP08396.1 hypothetical protein D7U36_09695 [Propionibacterium australiense]SYZ33945.1 Prokaryotic membrane lipoprotein lipid attachment site profile [Propionibacterium australiense]VEH88903.1 Uncharacterised protein [Propionibacterium australiense]